MQSLSATPQLVSWLSQGISPVLVGAHSRRAVLRVHRCSPHDSVDASRTRPALRPPAAALQQCAQVLVRPMEASALQGRWNSPHPHLRGIHRPRLARLHRSDRRRFLWLCDAGPLRAVAGRLYETVTDYAATIVFLCMIVAIVRRVVLSNRHATKCRSDSVRRTNWTLSSCCR